MRLKGMFQWYLLDPLGAPSPSRRSTYVNRCDSKSDLLNGKFIELNYVGHNWNIGVELKYQSIGNQLADGGPRCEPNGRYLAHQPIINLLFLGFASVEHN